MAGSPPCEPFRATAVLALLVMALITQTHVLQPPPQPREPQAHSRSQAPEIPALWGRLGARTPSEVARLSRTVPRRTVFALLVEEYLAPWSSPTGVLSEHAPISAPLIDSMEVTNKASTARIRLSGDGRVLYRVVEHWEKTYRLPRLNFFLDLLVKTLERFPELNKVHCEFYLNTADGPRVTIDSVSQEFGALPMLAFRTEDHYIDVPMPDPVEHGSKVTGAGYTVEHIPRVAWENKQRRAVFRGVASCIQKQHFGNWHLSPRVRVSTISSRYPHLLDAGITQWIKLSHNTTINDVERSANTSAKTPMTLEEQMQYRYILDVDGGLGSSRKRWMLMSGSTPFFQRSAVFQWYEPLLAKWVHYVPVDRWFRDLVENVEWARQNDHKSKEIANNAEAFAERFLSEDAVLEFFAEFLQQYAALQPDARHGNVSVPNPCVEEPSLANGPMGCRTGWFRHFLGVKLPFGCRHKPNVEGSFVCHRPHPLSGRKEVKHGVNEPYPPSAELEIPRKRPTEYQDTIIW